MKKKKIVVELVPKMGLNEALSEFPEFYLALARFNAIKPDVTSIKATDMRERAFNKLDLMFTLTAEDLDAEYDVYKRFKAATKRFDKDIKAQRTKYDAWQVTRNNPKYGDKMFEAGQLQVLENLVLVDWRHLNEMADRNLRKMKAWAVIKEHYVKLVRNFAEELRQNRRNIERGLTC